MNKDNLNNFIKESKLSIKELEIIEELIKLRNKNNLSQRDLASKTGIKQPIIANLERGKHSPTLNTLIKIIDTYGYKIVLEKEN